MKYNYFNLINDLKSTLLVDSEEPSIDSEAYNDIVKKLNWYRLPQDLQKLVDLINHSSTVLDVKVNWFNVREKAEDIFNNFN